MIEHLISKSWMLYGTDMRDPFFISDNPVTLHNDIDMGLFGNLGIALKGIQIHIPLSSTLTLALICPSITKSFMEAKRKAEEIIVTAPHLLGLLKRPFELIKLCNAYESGTPIIQSTENVRFLNSLQVSFSEQYVFCEKDQFNLVKEMLNNNEQYKIGPRMHVD